MPDQSFERHVRHSPTDMLALVADVKSYPDFVPYCTAMHVSTTTGAPETCIARMSVAFGPLVQTYSSKVVVDRQALTVTASAVDGPFSHLDSQWRFFPEGEGAKVTFKINFGFSNPLIAAIAEPVFAAKQEEIIDAFMDEADRRYA